METDPHIDPKRRKGRAASSNHVGRFEPYTRVPVDDGWPEDQDLPPVRTDVRKERPRSIITRNTSPDIPFDRSINPYRGCEHGCIYCFARPTHAYLGLSPGLDFETRLIARPTAPQVLERQLAHPRYTPAVMAIGTNTDPYQPLERDMKIMRQILEVLWEYRHPVAIVTKGALIERDLDILSDMAAANLVHVGVSVTTLDRKLARRLEPRVPDPERRLRTIQQLHAVGVPVRVMIAPVIPALTDHELETILRRARSAGAAAASWVMLRLPLEVSSLFQEWLHEHYPNRAARVMGHVRDMHGGREYMSDWGRRMRGEGPYADLIAARFRTALGRMGYSKSLGPLDCSLFRVPPRPGDQLSLF